MPGSITTGIPDPGHREIKYGQHKRFSKTTEEAWNSRGEKILKEKSFMNPS